MLQPASIPAGAADQSPDVAAVYSPPAPPSISAKAAFVYDASAQTPLFALDPDKRLAPASLTKIATALVVFAHARLDDKVTIAESDLVDASQSRVGLDAGDTLTVRDLLVGLLVPSGNDAGRALARYVGSQLDPSAADPEAAIGVFVAEMNKEVASLGLHDTQFANPTGIDAERHYSSAHDIAILMAKGLENPAFAEMIGTSHTFLASAKRPDGYEVFTTNDLLKEGLVSGGKTGTTAAAGGCLATAIAIGRNRVVSVVLGSSVQQDQNGNPSSPARFNDMRAILAALQQDYVWLDPAASDRLVGLPEELAVWQAYLPDGAELVVPAQRGQELRYRLVLGPQVQADQQAGRVLFFVGSDLLTERPVLQRA